MRSTPTKREFVRLRAEGKSFSTIAATLHISKSTCTRWDDELAEAIGEAKRIELEELFEEYGMAKAGRVRQLGTALAKLDEAIAAADFSTVRPDRLLELRLRYAAALKEEYVAPLPAMRADGMEEDAVLDGMVDLLDRVRRGEGGHAVDEARVLGEILKVCAIVRQERLSRSLMSSFAAGDCEDYGEDDAGPAAAGEA